MENNITIKNFSSMKQKKDDRKCKAIEKSWTHLFPFFNRVSTSQRILVALKHVQKELKNKRIYMQANDGPEE